MRAEHMFGSMGSMRWLTCASMYGFEGNIRSSSVLCPSSTCFADVPCRRAYLIEELMRRLRMLTREGCAISHQVAGMQSSGIPDWENWTDGYMIYGSNGN
nr:hypothetical protein CFP56_72021 [Quercus suber]